MKYTENRELVKERNMKHIIRYEKRYNEKTRKIKELTLTDRNRIKFERDERMLHIKFTIGDSIIKELWINLDDVNYIEVIEDE